MGTDETRDLDFDPYAVYFDPDSAILKVIGWARKRERFTPLWRHGPHLRRAQIPPVAAQSASTPKAATSPKIEMRVACGRGVELFILRAFFQSGVQSLDRVKLTTSSRNEGADKKPMHFQCIGG
jgi:hypothetical protein